MHAEADLDLINGNHINIIFQTICHGSTDLFEIFIPAWN